MPNFYGWRLLAVFWAILMIASAIPLYAGGVLNGYMFKEMNASRDWYSIPMSLLQFVFGLGALGMAAVIARFGVKGTLAIGGVAGAVGSFVLASLVQTPLQATLVFGLIVGAGFCIAGGIATQVGVTRWFLNKRALAIAILMSAPGVGGFFTAPMMNRFVASMDGEWRMGWAVAGVLFLFASLLSVLFVKEDPADVGAAPDGFSNDDKRSATGTPENKALRNFVTQRDWTIREVLKHPLFWGLLVCGIGVNIGMTLYFAIGITHLQDVGRTATIGAWALGVYGISALLSKFVLGAFGDRVDPRFIWAGMIAVFGCGALLLANARIDVALNLFPVLMGLGYGGHIACMLAVVSNYFGKMVFPAAAGAAVAITTCSGALAPFLAKGFYDGSGTYSPAFVLLAIWSLIGGAVMVFLKRPVINDTLSG